MKHNVKGFLALGLSVAMVMSPAAVQAAPEGQAQTLQVQENQEPEPAAQSAAAEEESSAGENQKQEDAAPSGGQGAGESTEESGQKTEENAGQETDGTEPKEDGTEGEDQSGDNAEKSGPEGEEEGTDSEESGQAVGAAAADDSAALNQNVGLQNKNENIAALSVDIDGNTYDDGNYSLEIESSYKMFKIIESRAEVKGDRMMVTIRTSSGNYPYLYIGHKEDEVKEPVIAGTPNEEDGYNFTFEVPASAMGTQLSVVPGKALDNWYTGKDVTLTLPAVLEKEPEVSPEPTPEPTPEPGEETGSLEDGSYQTGVESSSGMFKVVDCVLTSKGGLMSAVITLSGTGYDKLYMGTAVDAEKALESEYISYVTDSEGRYTFTVPVEALDTGIAVAAHSVKKDLWYDRTLTFQSEGMDKIEEETCGLEDGTYQTNVESSASMFKVVDCVLTSKGGQMSAVITLSGTGYDKLYMGTAADAEKASESEYISYVTDSEGRYTFTVPVAALDTGIAVAAHSVKKDLWYDRTLTFQSEGMEKIEDLTDPDPGTDPENPGGDTQEPGDNPGTTPGGNTGTETKPGNDGKPDTESSYTSDLSGSTGAVNNSTTLADGVYTPDSFSWSGGSGRVGISCNKVTITGGQAYATLVFSSSSYQYVKANGNIYYGTQSGDTSVFVIPVALNRNNQIIGMTTRMSAAHEITYSIYVYLAAAAGNGSAGNGTSVIGAGQESSQTLDETAPEIIGLEYESETELEHAEYFKIYHYSQDVTLLEIDLTRDTGREDLEEEQETETDAEDTAGGEADAEETAAGNTADGEESSEKRIDPSEVYKGNVVKYLIVPEDVEIPAGLEKEVVIVQLPADKVYAASNDILEQLEELELLDNVAVVGCEQEDCAIEAVAEAMEDEEIIYGGSWDEPDYRELVKSECNLALLPGEVLPQKDDKETDQEKDGKTAEKTAAKKEDSKEAAADAAADEEEELTLEEQEERLAEIMERCATLGIPLVIDRSADEETELGRYEWLKVYGVLFGCEEETDALYQAAVEAAEQAQSDGVK